MKPVQKYDIQDAIKRIAKPVIIIMILAFVGTIGFELVEGYDPLSALYMTIISLTTVGYETPAPLSLQGKLFTCIYLLFSVVIFLYLGSEFARHVISLNFKEFLSKRQMDTRIKSLKNHYLICGYGRTGVSIAGYLQDEDLDLVIIDNDQDVVIDAAAKGFLTVLGDATNDEVLLEARVDVAKGLFASLDNDADNLFVTIAAKEINSDIDIVVRCMKPRNKARFLRAGASSIVSPYTISGRRMVSSVVRPLVAEFLDEVMDTKLGLQLRMEQITIPEDSVVINKTIVDSGIRPNSGAYILAIQRNGDFMHNPTADITLKPGDIMIVLGSTDQLLKLEKYIL